MKKGTFYCATKSDGGIIAKKVRGYSDGVLGVCKSKNGVWILIHIPTGFGLSRFSCKRNALRAKEIALKSSAEYIAAHMQTNEYEDFVKSKAAAESEADNES
jgi:hypothetical protein